MVIVSIRCIPIQVHLHMYLYICITELKLYYFRLVDILCQDERFLLRTTLCLSSLRKKVPGFISDDTGGRLMLEFIIILRATTYAYILEGE